jgi:hypothetical protein
LKKSSVGKIRMSEVKNLSRKVISAQDANLRWEQALALYSTFTEIWISNPQLAKQAGRRVQELMMPIDQVQLLHRNDLN